jgi:predicted TPR repeat methyltransferase
MVMALAAGNTEGAPAWLRRATDKDPTFAQLYLQIGLIQERSGRTEPAIAAYRMYLELAPDGTYSDALRQSLQRLTPVTRSDGF